jgi:hypothetical protein
MCRWQARPSRLLLSMLIRCSLRGRSLRGGVIGPAALPL